MDILGRRVHAHVLIVLALLVVGCSDETAPTGADPSDPDGGNGSNGGSDVTFNSEAAPGDSARAFLDDRQFTRLHLEVDYMRGYEPTQAAFDSLKTALNSHLSKSSIRIHPVQEIAPGNQSSYSTQDIRDLEEQHRDHYTRADSDTLWAYFLVVDGEYTDENVLGVAYYNTSMAFFGKTIENVSSGIGAPSRSKVEAAVFRHEVGHNLGLVNNGIPMQQDHQDDGNGPHCTNDQCVMYYAIETTDYFSNLFDGTIPSFEHYCEADMQAQDGA